MIVALDHIAIAVPDLEKSIKRFMEDFGLPFEGTEDVVAAKTTTAFFPLPPTNIELVHPLNGEGPIAGYLEKRGGGLHHLCFKCDDMQDQLDSFKSQGIRMHVEPQPGEAFENEDIAFLYAKHGLNIELIDTDKKAKQL